MLTTKIKTWTPAINLQETDRELMVKVQIPGVRKEELKIRVEKNVLNIEGEHQEKQCAVDDFLCQELEHGKFQRAITLPAPINVEKVSAELVDGILTVVIPKK
jgi:HSP20 family protein